MKTNDAIWKARIEAHLKEEVEAVTDDLKLPEEWLSVVITSERI